MRHIIAAAALLAALSACSEREAADSHDAFMQKCLPVAQLMEQRGGGQSLQDGENAGAACACAWDRVQTGAAGPARPGSAAIRSAVGACLMEMNEGR